jgi:putative transposase
LIWLVCGEANPARIQGLGDACGEAECRDVVDHIEMLSNPKRRHGHANDVSPVEFESQYFNRLRSVQESPGDSSDCFSGN